MTQRRRGSRSFLGKQPLVKSPHHFNKDTMSNTIEELKQLIQNQLGVDTSKIEVDKPISDYGIDSLSLVELIFLIEEHFGIDFPDAAPGIDTLSGLARLVDQLRPVATA